MDAPASLQGLNNTLNEMLAAINALTQQVKASFPGTYATGTWTPALQFGGSAVGITYSTQLGSYTQVGRLVRCSFRLVLTNKGAQVGAATLAGLPFPANADVTNDGSEGLCPVYSNMSGLTETPVLTVAPSASAVQFLTFGAAASAALADTAFTNTSVINGSFSYFT